jgi:hypothetical protein
MKFSVFHSQGLFKTDFEHMSKTVRGLIDHSTERDNLLTSLAML